MTPNEIMNRYLLARIIDWRHELELLDAETVAILIKALKSANNRLRQKIAEELPTIWDNYTAEKGGAAIKLWLGDLLTDPAMQVENTITDAWVISGQSSLAAYNEIMSFNGMAKNVATVPITVNAIKGLADKKLFAGYTLGQLVAKAFTQGQITALIDSLNNGIQQGWSYPKVIKDLEQKALDAGAEINRRETITLARSYIQQASVNAQLAVFERNKRIIKGVKWTAILDNRVCPLCFEGTTEVIPFGKLRGVTKRPYVGDIVIVTTADGLQIRATPKHPVLTLSGWCALEKLNPGDQIIYAKKRDALNILGKQEINMPTKFSELFDFFSSQSFSEVKRYRTTADAFNGDSGIFNDQIATICKNRFLESNIGYPALAQFIPYKRFTVDNSSLVFFSGNSAFDVIFNRMCAWAFGLSTPLNTGFSKSLIYKCFSESALFHNLFNRKALLVKHDYFSLFFLAILASFSSGNIWHSLIFDKQGSDCSSTGIKMFSNLSGGSSLPVHIKNVVNIRREFMSSGHVYNLHCDEELYTANGFIVKNCAATDGLSYTWDEERPPMPRHPRCLLPYTLVSASDAIAGFVAEYDGPVYDFELYNGTEFSITENHPILTEKGFLPACEIDKDTRIFCNDYEKNRFTAKTIKEIVGEMRCYDDWGNKIHDFEEIKVSKDGFHGDGQYCTRAGFIDFIPSSRDKDNLYFYRNPLNDLFLRLECDKRILSASEAWSNQYDILRKWHKKYENRGFALFGYKSKIKRHYKGPVFDLQTLSSMYYADGAIVSNCRCLWLPWVKSWRDLGIDADDLKKAARPWLIREKGNIDEGGNRKILNYGKTTEDFGGWWATLPFDQQAQIIGPVRTRLIREGKLQWEDLMNKNSGKYYTLAELGFSESGKKL